MPDNKELLAALKRIERKLDALIAALAEEQGEEGPGLTLDGELAGGERVAGMPL